MAVNAKSGGGIIEATNAIIDTLTTEAFRAEFRSVLQELQSRRDVINVAKLNDPNVVEVLEGDTRSDYKYTTSGLYDALWKDVYIRIGMREGKLICSDDEPVLVTKLSFNGISRAKGVNKTFYHYLVGVVNEDEFIEAILKDAKRKVTTQLRKFMLGKPSIGELFNKRVPHQFFTDAQILEGMVATPTYLFKKTAAEWDAVLPDWIRHLERYIEQHLNLSFGYSKTGFDDFMPAMLPIMDRLSDSSKNALYRKIAKEAIERGSVSRLHSYVEVPEDIVREAMDQFCSELVNTKATMDMRFRAMYGNSGEYAFSEDLAGDSRAHGLIQAPGLIDTKEYSRLLFNPNLQRTRLSDGDRLVFTPVVTESAAPLGQLRKFASPELNSYLSTRHRSHNSIPYTPTATLTWFRIIAETDYGAQVTIMQPTEKVYEGLKVQREMQKAIRATLGYERKTILANWDLLVSATGLDIDLDLDKYEAFWNSVVIDLIQFEAVKGDSWRTPYTSVFTGQLLEKR